MSQDPTGGAPTWGTPSAGSGWGAPVQTPPGVAASPRPSPNGGAGLPSPGTSSSPISAPMQWLAVAAALEVVGVFLALAAVDRPLLSLLGWLLGGFGAMGVLAVYTLADAKRRTDPWYSSTSLPGRLRAVLVAASVVVVALNAWQFADWASRR